MFVQQSIEKLTGTAKGTICPSPLVSDIPNMQN